MPSNKPSSTKYSSLSLITTVSCLIFYLICSYFFASRGVDITDQGYFLGMDLTWQDPYFMPSVGTNIFIHFFKFAFGNYTLFASKYLAQIVPLLICILFYLPFRKQLNLNKISLSLMILASFWTNRSTLAEWTYYNTLSTLFLSTTVILLYFSYINLNYKSYILAVLTLILTFSIKITNLVFIIFIPVTLISLYLKYGKKIGNKYSLYSLSILLLTTIVIVGVDYNYASQSLALLLNTKKNLAEYDSSFLLQKNWMDFESYLLPSLSFAGYLLGSYLIFLTQVKFRIPLLALINLAFLFAQYHLQFFEWQGLFVFYLVCLLLLIWKNCFPQFRLLFIFLTLLLLLGSAGSNNGLKPSFISEPLICFALIAAFSTQKLAQIHRDLLKVTVLCLMCLGIACKISYTYRDLNKIQLNVASINPRLQQISTNRQRVKILDQLYSLRTNQYKKISTALIYPSAPLLHYILDLKSLLPNPWVNLYDHETLKNKLNNSKLPEQLLVIRLNTNPRYKDWPGNPKSLESDRNYQSILELDKFLLDKGALLKEHNQYFNLYVIETHG